MENALLLLREMRHDRVAPSTLTFNAAISSCEKRTQWQQALELLSEMWHDRVAPDTIDFNAAITACDKGMQWKPA